VETAPMSKRLTRAFSVLACLWVGAVIVLFITKPPFWALMDDSNNVGYVLDVQRDGTSFLNFVGSYVHRDLENWGMFRPVYPAFVYTYYGLFKHHSGAAYFLNAVFLFLLFYLWALFFEKFFWSKPADHTKVSFWAFLTLCFIFTPHYNLFFFLSLQEKFVLWGGLLVFGSMLGLESGSIGTIWGILGILTGTFLALLSKATGLFLFGPLFLWLLLLTMKDKKNLPILILTVFVYLGAAWYFASIRSSYSSGYSFGDMPGRLLAAGPRFHLFFLPALFVLLFVLGYGFKKKENLSRIWRVAFWPVGLLSYLVIMLPWKGGVGYYLLVPAGIFSIGMLISLFCLLPLKEELKSWVLLVSLIGASVFSFQKFMLWSSEHHGTGPVITYLKELNISNGVMVVAMPEPCQEAHLALSFFLGKPGEIKIASNNVYPEVASTERKILVTDRYCSSNELDGFTPDRVLFSSPPWFVYEDLPPS
jgi:hypothetical protein